MASVRNIGHELPFTMSPEVRTVNEVGSFHNSERKRFDSVHQRRIRQTYMAAKLTTTSPSRSHGQMLWSSSLASVRLIAQASAPWQKATMRSPTLRRSRSATIVLDDVAPRLVGSIVHGLPCLPVLGVELPVGAVEITDDPVPPTVGRTLFEPPADGKEGDRQQEEQERDHGFPPCPSKLRSRSRSTTSSPASVSANRATCCCMARA